MSVLKRGKVYHLKIRPFGQQIMVRTAAQSKAEARVIEVQILTACRSSDYRALDPRSREVCTEMFRNRGWSLPPDLWAEDKRPTEELTLWRAIERFLNYPTVKDAKAKPRYIHCLTHLVRHFGKDRPVKTIWVPDLREYQVARVKEGLAPGTINWQLSTLSRLFAVMIELQLVEANPVRLVKRLSTKSSERQVYLSVETVTEIGSRCPDWFKPILWTAFYTGARRGELLELTRKRVKLSKRMLYFAPPDVKENDWKRVPIHRELVPILEQVMKTRVLGSDQLFFLQDEIGLRPLGVETFKNIWERDCEKLQAEEKKREVKEEDAKWNKPWPRLHDLRATWKTNARRSGMDPEIREAILGHWSKERSVSERYGYISDQELLSAIDTMNFDNGETVVWLAGERSTVAGGSKMVASPPQETKRPPLLVT